jgi:hypothetical protein
LKSGALADLVELDRLALAVAQVRAVVILASAICR